MTNGITLTVCDSDGQVLNEFVLADEVKMIAEEFPRESDETHREVAVETMIDDAVNAIRRYCSTRGAIDALTSAREHCQAG